MGIPSSSSSLATRAAEAGNLSLDEVLWARIGRLEPEVLQTLQLIALAGVPLAPKHLAEAAGATPAAFATRLEQLQQGNLIRSFGPPDEGALECYHDRVRETVLVHLDGSSPRLLHRRLGEVLERAGLGESEPDRVMYHFELAGDPGRAAPYAQRAAAQAERALAFEQAVDLYRAALRLGPAAPDQARNLRRNLAQALVNAGRGREAAETFLAVAEGAPASDALECQRRAAEQFLISGHAREGLQTLRQVLAALGIGLPGTPVRLLSALLWARVRIRLRGLAFTERDASAFSPAVLTRLDLCWSATVGLSMIDPLRGALFEARHMLLALRAGERSRVTRSLAAEAAHLASTENGTSDRARRLLERAAALARALDEPYGVAFVEMMHGIVAFLTGRWRMALEHVDRAGTLFRERCTGVAWEADNCAAFGIWSLWYRGEMVEMFARVRRLVEEAEVRGDLYASIALKTSLCNVVWLARDDLPEARRHVDQARERWGVEGFQMQSYWILLAGVMLHAYAGEGEAAWSLMTRAWRPLARSLLLRVHVIDAQMVHMRAVAALVAAADLPVGPRRDGLLRSALADARRLSRKRLAGYPAIALLIEAGVAHARGELDRARTCLERAAPSFQAAEMALYAAAAKHRLGEILGGERGEILLAEARTFMAAQDIRNPDRMLRLLAPGFGQRPPAHCLTP